MGPVRGGILLTTRLAILQRIRALVESEIALERERHWQALRRAHDVENEKRARLRREAQEGGREER
jgi:hypothetical protein